MVLLPCHHFPIKGTPTQCSTKIVILGIIRTTLKNNLPLAARIVYKHTRVATRATLVVKESGDNQRSAYLALPRLKPIPM